MSTFPLRIGTPDGLLYEGEVARLVCRTINGDLAILPRHCNYCTALGMGEAHIVLEDGSRKNAACIGGMLSVMNGTCHVLATTWEWEEDKKTVNRARKVQRYLSQSFSVAEQFTGMAGTYVPLKETLRGFRMILDGACDEIPESCFLFAGNIDEVFEKAKVQNQ